MATVDYKTLLEDIKEAIQPELEKITQTPKWESLTEWLAKLFLLKGVPFQYLVPNARMLQQETIKFFQLDQNWLTAVIDGAYSIGRTSSKDDPSLSEWLETELYQYLTPAIHKAANKMRWHQLHPKKALDDNYANDALATGKDIILTGFLLRSQVLTDFSNMQVVGYDRDNVPTSTTAGQALPIVRLDHLADGLLIGIFVGQLYRLDLREPSENLHYGIDNLKSANAKVSTFSKELRNASGVEEPKATLSSPTSLFRTPPSTGAYKPSGAVMNMHQLSQSMFNELKNNTSTPDTVPYKDAKTDGSSPQPITALTSADFALQMTEGAAMVSYIFE